MKRQSVALMLAVFGALAPVGCARTAAPEVTKETTAVPATIVGHPALATLPAGSATIADVAEKVLPAVVNISSTWQRRAESPRTRFFGPSPHPEQGTGSGVVVSRDGLILTNNHVIAGAREIKVTTSDKREFKADIVGADPKSDLAVIKLKSAANLTPIEMGDSGKLRLGDVVLAIGNPFGVGQTVTMGIVSAKGRADVGIVQYEDFIQTDAAINPGNSGGALVNMEGKLVGINTAILSRSGGYMGIGFAIPTNMARPIMDSLQKHGRVVRGFLGVNIQDVDADLAQALKLPTAEGVLVSGTQLGTPADRAGIKQGDVVLKVNGVRVTSSGQLRNAIAAAGADAVVKLDILRDGKPQTIDVKLSEMRQETTQAKPPSGGHLSLDGLTLQQLDKQTRQRFSIPGEVRHGVVVTEVQPGSPAAHSGLRAGDVLLEVNRRQVTNLDRFKELLQASGGRTLLLVHRDGSTIYVVLRR